MGAGRGNLEALRTTHAEALSAVLCAAMPVQTSCGAPTWLSLRRLESFVDEFRGGGAALEEVRVQDGVTVTGQGCKGVDECTCVWGVADEVTITDSGPHNKQTPPPPRSYSADTRHATDSRGGQIQERREGTREQQNLDKAVAFSWNTHVHVPFCILSL